MYFEIINDVSKSEYTRKGVLSNLKIEDSAQEADNVSLIIDNKYNSIVIEEEKVEKYTFNIGLLNKFGIPSEIKTIVDIMMVDETKFIVVVKQGCIFVKGEEKEDELAMLDVSNCIKKSITENSIGWITAKGFLSLLKSGSCGKTYGELVSTYPYDYIYSMELLAYSNFDKKSGKYLAPSIKYKCILSDDISNGRIGMELRQHKINEYKRLINNKSIFNKTIKETFGDDVEYDNEYLYEDDEDENEEEASETFDSKDSEEDDEY